MHLADVEALKPGGVLREGRRDEVELPAYAHCADKYVLLDSGSALDAIAGRCSSRSVRFPPRTSLGAASRSRNPRPVPTANFPPWAWRFRLRATTELLFPDIEPAVADER